jgi:hypothetical protein
MSCFGRCCIGGLLWKMHLMSILCLLAHILRVCLRLAEPNLVQETISYVSSILDS